MCCTIPAANPQLKQIIILNLRDRNVYEGTSTNVFHTDLVVLRVQYAHDFTFCQINWQGSHLLTSKQDVILSRVRTPDILVRHSTARAESIRGFVRRVTIYTRIYFPSKLGF